jgi:hypothetical protein
MLTQTFPELLTTLRVKLRYCGLKCVEVVRNEDNYSANVTKNAEVRELRRVLISSEVCVVVATLQNVQLNAAHLLRPFR